MFNSQGIRGVFFAAAAAAFLAIAGCSNQTPNQVTNQAPAPPRKADTGKSAAKPAAAKPAAKKPDSAKAVTAKSQPAKPVAVSSKTVSSKPASGKPVSDKAAPTTLVTIPKGTAISATVGQALASNKNHSGDSFAAVLSSSIKVDGKTVIPKGAHVTGRVVTAKKKSPPELTVALASVDINGKSYKLVTDPINRAPKTQAKSDAGDAEAAKAEKDISLPAQSHLKFKLAKPVKIPIAVKS
jgi:hypothetical protein